MIEEHQLPAQRKGTRASPSWFKPYLLTIFAFLKEVGAGQIKQTPGLGPFLAALEKLAEAEDNREMTARLDGLLTVGQQTRDQVDDLAALAGCMIVLQHEHGALLSNLVERLEAAGLPAGMAQLTDVALETALIAYRSRLAQDYQYADYRGIEGVTRAEHAASFPLDDVYILPNLLMPGGGIVHSREQELLDTLLKRAEDLTGEQRVTLEREYAELTGQRWRVGEKGMDQPLPVSDALRQTRHAVVLGGPGVGKSTLTRYLARTLALGMEAAKIRLDWEEAPIPVVLPLAAYADARRQCPALSLRNFLGECMAKRGGAALRDGITRELEAGRVFLLLDGVDEIPDVRERATMVQAVDRFIADHDANRIWVTSRPYGYIRLAGDILHFQLPNFTSEQMKAFVHQWQRAFERWQHPRAPDLAQAERKAQAMVGELNSNEKLAELATNPLMLVIIALIRLERARLPEQRVQLYQRAVNTLMDTWNYWRSQTGSDVGGERLPLDRLVPVWAAVAEWMHRSRPTGVVHRQELRRKLVEVLEDKEYDEADPAATAESYLNAAAARAGLLEERGKDIFAFWHPTFEEFLAAVNLATPTACTSARLLPLRDDSRWREVILLAVSYVGVVLRDSDTATRLVEAIAFEKPGPLEGVLHPHLRLAVACLADDAGIRRSLAKRLIVTLADILHAQPYDPLSHIFVSAARAVPNLRCDADSVATLAHLADYPNSETRMEAARLFANVASTIPKAKALCGQLLEDKDPDVRCHAALGLARSGDYRPAVWRALSAFGNGGVHIEAAAREFFANLPAEAEQALAAWPLEAEDPDLRSQAANILQKMGRADERMVQTLVASLLEA